MKLQFAIVLVALFFEFSASDSAGISKITRRLNLMQTCQERSGASVQDVELIKNRKMPRSKPGKCMVECILTQVKIVEEGRFNKNGFIILLTPTTKGDVTKMGKVREFAETCSTEIGNGKLENCEAPEKIFQCIARNAKKYDLDMPKIKTE